MTSGIMLGERSAQAHAPVAHRPFAAMLGQSEVHLASVKSLSALVATGVRDVFLVGPPGSGKALAARCMHDASPRAAEAFLTIDCGALAASALEADLFGQAPGVHGSAYGREGLISLAGAGTVFLRRIDLLPAEFQPRMLEVLRDRVARPADGQESIEVRCSFIASAGPAIPEMVEAGQFDRSLYNHLKKAQCTLPGLKERGNDIELLAMRFLAEMAEESGSTGGPERFSDEVLDRLKKHKWPGNVRELRRSVRSAYVAADGPEVDAAALRLRRVVTRRAAGGQIHIPAAGKSLAQIEAEAIEITLRQNAGNKSATARVLGVSRPRLQRKLDKYELE